MKKTKRTRRAKGTVVAADLGTDTTLLAHMSKDNHVRVIPDWDGLLSTPTAVGFEGGDPKNPLFGRAAKSYRKTHPEFVCVIAKRARGRGNAPGIIDIHGKAWTTEELEALFLHSLLEHAEEFLGEAIAGVLSTVPASFNDAQRRATQEIVRMAGYACVGTVNEPTAALLSYARDKAGAYAVGDIGGGTFDVSILRVEKGHVYTTLATGGQDDLGGREYTLALLRQCVDHASQQGVALDPADDLRDMVGIELACEEAKKELSTQKSTIISFRVHNQLMDLEVDRNLFEDLTRELSQRIHGCLVAALEQAGLKASDLDGIVFAGGGSRVPSARKDIEAAVGDAKVLKDIDPDTAIVTGACYAIGMKLEERRLAGDVDLVENVPQYLLEGDVTLRDILGHDLGVAAVRKSTGEQVLAAIVSRGAALPASATKVFGLSNGDADTITTTITVLEGDADALVAECHSLAEFPLNDMPSGPTEDRIEIRVEVDSNGVVELHAMDTHSDVELRRQVEAAAAVSRV